jgi:hypothetical protein
MRMREEGATQQRKIKTFVGKLGKEKEKNNKNEKAQSENSIT